MQRAREAAAEIGDGPLPPGWKRSANGFPYKPIRSDEAEAEMWKNVSREYKPTPETYGERLRLNAEPTVKAEIIRAISNLIDPNTKGRRNAKMLNALSYWLQGKPEMISGYKYGGLKKVLDKNASRQDRVKAFYEMFKDWWRADGEDATAISEGLLGKWKPESKAGIVANGLASSGIRFLVDPAEVANAIAVKFPLVNGIYRAAQGVADYGRKMADQIDSEQTDRNNRFVNEVINSKQGQGSYNANMLNMIYDAINEEK